jgi:hypothetical protein
MPSERSKLIWEQSAPLFQYVANALSQDIREKPTISSAPIWQLGEYLVRIAGGLVGPTCIPDRVKNAVSRGAMVASGVRDRPSESPGPVEIPRDHFLRGDFRILLNVLVCDEYRYQQIRLIKVSELPSSLLIARPNQEARQLAIRGVIQSLVVSGQLDGKLRKQQVAIVRVALAKAGIANVGSDKTVERQIRNNSFS